MLDFSSFLLSSNNKGITITQLSSPLLHELLFCFLSDGSPDCLWVMVFWLSSHNSQRNVNESRIHRNVYLSLGSYRLLQSGQNDCNYKIFVTGLSRISVACGSAHLSFVYLHFLSSRFWGVSTA